MHNYNETTMHNTRDELENDRLAPLRSLTARRSLVGLAAGLWLASTVLFWFEAPFGAGALIGLLALGCWALLSKLVRSTDAAKDSELDERLVTLRNSAYRLAYIIVVLVGIIALLALTMAESAGLQVQGSHLTALFWAFLVGATLAPACVLAWTQQEV